MQSKSAIKQNKFVTANIRLAFANLLKYCDMTGGPETKKKKYLVSQKSALAELKNRENDPI